MHFSTLYLTERGLNTSSNSNICTKSCSFILYHTRHLQKTQLWAVILGVALRKIFRNEAPVSLGGGSWNPYQPTPIQHPWRFCLLSFFKQTTRPFSSLLFPYTGGSPLKAALFGVCPAHCMCAGSTDTSQAARNCSYTRKVCLYSDCWASTG